LRDSRRNLVDNRLLKQNTITAIQTERSGAVRKAEEQFENVRLTRFEFKFLPALRRWAARTKFVFV
jgi:hypothetical protein